MYVLLCRAKKAASELVTVGCPVLRAAYYPLGFQMKENKKRRIEASKSQSEFRNGDYSGTKFHKKKKICKNLLTFH